MDALKDMVFPVRGIDFCRGCSSRDLFTALEMGQVPIANELITTCTNAIDEFDLTLSICNQCGLGQIGDFVSRQRIFEEYRYLSSMSSTFLAHAERFANYCKSQFLLNENDYVLEIASNDGYMLKYFRNMEVRVLGVEPAKNVANIAISNGIDTIPDFFGEKLAKAILQKHGFPRLIIANNVLAHVPDVRDFLEGLSIIVGPKTIVSVENPPLSNILNKSQFDTVYHEHFSYLSATSVSYLVAEFGLTCFDLESIETHGGSFRFWISKSSEHHVVNKRVFDQIDAERKMGLFDYKLWLEKNIYTKQHLAKINAFLCGKFQEGKRIYGYGAAAKASTLINASKISEGIILGIFDTSPEKAGRFMPRLNTPIISSSELATLQVDLLIVFPWNITKEIVSFVKQRTSGLAEIWHLIPDIEQLA